MQTCPNNCHLWARGITPNEPMTHHNPRCSHVDDSLIDVWRVSLCGTSYVTDTDPDKDENCKDAKVTREKMHREIYENLPEFAGF